MTISSRGSHKYFLAYFLFLFICFTLKEKTLGEEAIRPLYYTGLIGLFAGVCIISFKFLFVSSKQMLSTLRIPLVTAFLSLYCIMILNTIGIPGRSLKDALLGSGLDIWLFLLLLLYSLVEKISLDSIAAGFAKFVLYTSIGSAILGIVIFIGDMQIPLGPITLKQQPYFYGRIIGHLGEPTHLGALIGAGMISAFYLLHLKGKKRYGIALFFLSIVLIMSGSRNAVVSSMLAILTMAFCIHPLQSVLTAILILCAVLAVGYIAVSYSEEASLLLIASFRIGDEGGQERLDIWAKAIYILNNSSFLELLLGHGYGYQESEMGASFNQILKFTIDFGLSFVVCFLYVIGYAFSVFARNIRRGGAHLLGMALLIYSLVFSMFIEVIFASFFHFASFSFLFSILVASRRTNISLKYTENK